MKDKNSIFIATALLNLFTVFLRTIGMLTIILIIIGCDTSQQSETDNKNISKIYDSGKQKQEYDFFQVSKDENLNIVSIEFWNSNLKKYNKSIDLQDLHPFKDYLKYPKLNESVRRSSIVYDISDLPSKQDLINKSYFPSYTDDINIVGARFEIHTEDLFWEDEKELISVNYLMEITNSNNQCLGYKSSTVLFDKIGNITDSISFDLPMFTHFTNTTGEYLGFIIGGFYGDAFETIYPETFKVYDIKNNEFILEDIKPFGLSMGGGSVDNRFHFNFENDNKVKMIIIDFSKRQYLEKVISKEEHNKLRYTKDAFYYKSNNAIAYKIPSDFIVKIF